jgi:uncharacterized protein
MRSKTFYLPLFNIILMLTLISSGLMTVVRTVQASSNSVVISQVYGGGGNSGAFYTHDFIELFNRGTTSISLDGWSVQYASSSGSSWQRTNLSGTLLPGQYYLIQEAQGAGGTSPLPTPDATGMIAMGATAGKVALVSQNVTLTESCPSEGIVDFVGYGSANCFEGTNPTFSSSNTTAVLRAGDGCIDTDDNRADFITGSPNPRNTASDFHFCPVGPTHPIINEFVFNHVGTDTHEYVEIYGDPDTDYSAYTIIQIEGDGTGAGVIDSAQHVGTTDANGLWVTDFLTNVFENGTVSLLLVEGFSGSVSDDLDTNNDGVLDSTPWASIVDDVAVSDGGAGDNTYSTTVLAPGFAGNPFTPGGASRIPNGVDTDSESDWTLNDFDGEGLPGFVGTPDLGEALNTPGETNKLAPVPVISQIYGGGGNTDATYTHDFIELFNRSTREVDINGWSVQYASAAGSTWQVTTLSGTLLPGQYFLVQQAQGAGGIEPLPTPDVAGNIPMSAISGKVALVNHNAALSGTCPGSTSMIDFVGYGSANCFEGSGAAPTLSNTTAAIRKDAGAQDTDDNSVDFEAGAPSPRNSSFGFGDQAPEVATITPSNGALDVPVNANIHITFSEPVFLDEGWFDLSCSLSGSNSASETGGPISYTLNPESDFVYGETCNFTVYADKVRDQDEDDPPDHMDADYIITFSTMEVNVCETNFTPVYEIQGSDLMTPYAGQTMTTQGVVVGDYEGPSPALRGFYMQDLLGDGEPATSDGIFIFNGNNDNVTLGEVVRVTGVVAEFQDQTQISASTIVSCGTGTVEPVDISLPFPSTEYLERYEGMLVRFPQTLYVTEHFQLGRFGQVVMSSGGRLQQPTNVVSPGAPALSLQANNNLNRIIIDDQLNNQNPDPILFGRSGHPLSASNTLRGGDTATGIVGVLTYTWSGNAASGNAYRLRPVNALGGGVPEFESANPRPDAPEDVGGSLKVVGLNLLNYFNTFTGCTTGVGGIPTDCRGAENQFEFDRQWVKTVEAIKIMDPDVLGVIEIENDGYGLDSAIQDLVNRLNAASAPGTYAFIDVDAATGQVNALGTDAIKVGLIYKPGSVAPTGSTAALNTETFVNGGDSEARNRPALAQTFEQLTNRGKFTVVVNHLKSKGSACDIPDTGDGQGNCNIVRLNAVNEMVNWLESDPTSTGDPDILILGDLNSYAKEDPITALLSAGYTNLIDTLSGPDAYSYVFDGQWGYLDHAISSSSLLSQVTGLTEWHINSDEPGVLDYNTNFKSANQILSLFAPDQFRVSDHDPVILGLNLDGVPVVTASPAWQEVQYSDPIQPVTVTAVDAPDDLPLSAETSWNYKGGTFSFGLPNGLVFSLEACQGDTCTWILDGTALVAPGIYIIRITVDDNDEGSAYVDISILVTQEDALATYSGALFAATASATSDSATVTLAATIQDFDDGFAGDIRNATVAFVDRDKSNTVLCSAPVGLVNLVDTTTGTATCDWQVDIGNADSIDARIGIIVDGYYHRNNPLDDSIVVVSRALTSNFITGGGYLLLTDSNGQLPGDPASRNGFGLNVKYNRSGRNLQGRVNILLVSSERVYQIKGNVLTSLVVQTDSGSAIFNGKATIQDVTDPDNPLDVDGNATLQISMTDNGEPGNQDSIAITVWNKDGGLYFSSHWNGVMTVEQYLGGGNLIVH